MKTIAWNDEKDAVLRADLDRGGIGLAECAEMIESGNLLAVVSNPSANHGDQQMYVLNIAGNAYCVPFDETDDYIFLKTLYPSRRFTALYLERR